MKLAIPRMGESVAPCFESCTTMAIFTVVESAVVDKLEFPLSSTDPFDRVRVLRDQGVDTVICGGMQESYEDLLQASGFRVISWVSGHVEDLLKAFLDGNLQPGMELPMENGPDLFALDRKTER